MPIIQWVLRGSYFDVLLQGANADGLQLSSALENMGNGNK